MANSDNMLTSPQGLQPDGNLKLKPFGDPCVGHAVLAPAKSFFTVCLLFAWMSAWANVGESDSPNFTLDTTGLPSGIGGTGSAMSGNFTLDTTGLPSGVGGARYADSGDFILDTTGLPSGIGGTGSAMSGNFTLDTTGLPSGVGGARYADSGDFVLDTTGLPSGVGGTGSAMSGSFTLDTTGLLSGVGGVGYSDSTSFILDTRAALVAMAFHLINPLVLPGRTFQFHFTNTPGVSFSVFGTTNLTIPFTNWTLIGTVTESPPGQFQFSDSAMTNYPKRFYRVSSP